MASLHAQDVTADSFAKHADASGRTSRPEFAYDEDTEGDTDECKADLMDAAL